MTDREVIETCLNGDSNAFRFLVERYQKRAYYAALTFVHRSEDAMDLTQDAFYRAFRSLSSFDTSKNFYTWFYRIIHNLSLNFIQQRKVQAHSRLDDLTGGELIAEDDSPLQAVLKDERKAKIWKALDELPPKDKEIILLRDFQDLAYRDIADILKIPEGSVMSRLYYARKKLALGLEAIYAG